MAFKKVGEGECPVCGREIVAKGNEVGTIKIDCPHCEFKSYAKEGTAAGVLMKRRFKVMDDPVKGSGLSGGLGGLFGGAK